MSMVGSEKVAAPTVRLVRRSLPSAYWMRPIIADEVSRMLVEPGTSR